MERLCYKLAVRFVIVVDGSQIHLYGVIAGGKLLKPRLRPSDLDSEGDWLDGRTGGTGFWLRFWGGVTGLTGFGSSEGRRWSGVSGRCSLGDRRSSLLCGRAGEAGSFTGGRGHNLEKYIHS